MVASTDLLDGADLRAGASVRSVDGTNNEADLTGKKGEGTLAGADAPKECGQ